MSWHIDDNGEVSDVNISNLPVTAYGELSVAEKTPITQITGSYGFTDQILTVVIGGTISNLNSMFQANSDVNPNSVVAILSDEQVMCKGGQGLVGNLSSIFDTPQLNNIQVAGLQTSDALIGFGFNGVDFGIVFANEGALEIQELTINTGASNNENATIFIDGNTYIVPITDSTPSKNAFEISEYLADVVPGYNFSSNSNVVECLALLPDFGSGIFSFSSPTATGTFFELEVGVLPNEKWTPKSQWNVDPNIDINPLLGNEFRIQYKHLGFGNIKFYIESPDGEGYKLVHIEKYVNTKVTPSVKTPIFRIGWSTRNSGNTNSVTVQGAGAELSVEGKYTIQGKASGECNVQTISSGDNSHILSIRNRLVFNGKTNRANVELNIASMSTEASKITTFNIYKNAITDDQFIWEYEDEQQSIVEFAKNNTIITGGEIIDCRTTRGDTEIDLSRLVKKLKPTEYLTISASYESGADADIAASISFNEDL